MQDNFKQISYNADRNFSITQIKIYYIKIIKISNLIMIK